MLGNFSTLWFVPQTYNEHDTTCKHRYPKLYNGIGNGSKSHDISVQILYVA